MTRLQKLRADVIAKRGRYCSYCGKGPLYKRALHLDHVVPSKLGGATDLHNLRPACSHCNRTKGAKPLDVYIIDRLARLEQEHKILTAIKAKLC